MFDSFMILLGEIICWSLLVVKGLIDKIHTRIYKYLWMIVK